MKEDSLNFWMRDDDIRQVLDYSMTHVMAPESIHQMSRTSTN